MQLLMSSHRHWGEASMLMENTGESGEGNDCLMEECGYQKKAEEGHMTYKTWNINWLPFGTSPTQLIHFQALLSCYTIFRTNNYLGSYMLYMIINLMPFQTSPIKINEIKMKRMTKLTLNNLSEGWPYWQWQSFLSKWNCESIFTCHSIFMPCVINRTGAISFSFQKWREAHDLSEASKFAKMNILESRTWCFA